MPLNTNFISSVARAGHLRMSSDSGSVSFSAGVIGARPTPKPKASFTYQSNGYTMNASGYLANPTHAAQVAANNAGALTRSEAASMGLPLGGRR
jgi:hypothetical protein